MQFTRFGNTGLMVSRLCPGTMTFGLQIDVAKPAITSPIIGTSRPGQLPATLAAVGTQIPPPLKPRLDELSAEYRRGDAPR